jgi:hypothetical protein
MIGNKAQSICLRQRLRINCKYISGQELMAFFLAEGKRIVP